MNQKLRNLVYTAMLIALCCVATLVIKIPTVTGGYLNAGDIVVVLAALLAGPLYGGVAAGFGSGLADVISGYMSYAPGTLVVKGCAAVVAALIFRACRKKNFGFALLSAICGEIIMVLGYFVFEDFVLGYGLAAAAEIALALCRVSSRESPSLNPRAKPAIMESPQPTVFTASIFGTTARKIPSSPTAREPSAPSETATISTPSAWMAFAASMISLISSQCLPVSIRISSMLGLISVGAALIPSSRSLPLVSRITGFPASFTIFTRRW